MKARAKCPKCNREFVANDSTPLAKGRLNANLANHMRGAHGLDWRTGNPIQPKLELSSIVEPARDKPKRTYNKQAKASAAVCYCPKCGCNIRAVQVAMGL